MATPIPVAKPASSGTATIIGILLLLVLVGTEYYYLTTRDTQRQLTQYALQHPTKAADKTTAPAPKGSKQKAGKAAAEKTTAAAGQPVPLDISTMMGADGSTDYLAEAFKQMDEWEALGVGTALRFVVWLAAVACLFLMTPPAPKVGAPRRVPRNPKSIVVIVHFIWVVLAFGLLALMGVGATTGELLTYGYPVSIGAVLGAGFVGGFLRASTKINASRLLAEKIKRTGPYAITLNVQGGYYVNVPNPFRGTLVLGGAGAGKTYSIGEPFLEQFIGYGMAGLIYDFKFPVLAGAAQKALLYAQPQQEKLLQLYQENKKANRRNEDGIFEGLACPIRHRVINFVDMERTEKVNPLRPQDMPTTAYAMEYAQTILTNLSPGGAKSGDNFFTKSAQAYLTGIIWYYRNNYPALCTIPHAVATAVYKDFTHVLSMLRQDESCAVLVQSLVTAVEQGAEKQIAGVVSSLQVDMSGLATAEISWVLAPDEDPSLGAESEGFSLNLNDPNNPTLLTIGNDPTLARTFSPVISCVIAVALKLMNQQHKQPSFVLIDEGATIYVPGLEVIPATARQNKVAMLYMTQDMAQLVDAYGKDKANVLVSNLSNQLIGKVNSAETAKLVSDMIGREDVEMVSVNTGQSMGATGSSSKGQSVSIQERQVFRVQDAYTLLQGEFVGQVVEAGNTFFQAQIERETEPGKYPIAKFTYFAAERGVVTGQMRGQLEKISNRDNAKLIEARKVLEVGQAAVGKDNEQQREKVRQDIGKPASSRRSLEAIQIQADSPNAKQEKDDIIKDIHSDIQSAIAEVIPDAIPAGAEETTATPEQEHDWEARTLAEPVAGVTPPPPLFNAAEQKVLEQTAALARRERERLKVQPNAAAAAAAVEQARTARRLEPQMQRATGSILLDMVQANHARIAREVAQAIDQSGDNSLSKAALAAAAKGQQDKAKASEMGKLKEEANPGLFG